MSSLALFLFGSPYIEHNHQKLHVDTRKAIALLAFLAVTQQRYRRDVLADLFWPEYDHKHARATLRRTLSALNKALNGLGLSADRETISLHQHSPIWVDVNAFQLYIKNTQQHQHEHIHSCPDCIKQLDAAASLYQNDFMAGFSLSDSANFDEWQSLQTLALRNDFLNILTTLVHAYSAKNEHFTAIEYTRRILSLDRTHEDAYRYLMELYTHMGQRTIALRQYEECKQVLRQELDVEPPQAMTLFYQALKAQTPIFFLPFLLPFKKQPSPFLTSPSTTFSKGTSPLPFVGRAKEKEQLISVYHTVQSHGHAFAIVGEAGIGKTRIAEELLAYTQQQGATTLLVRCYEGEEELAYSPLSALLRATNMQAPYFQHGVIAEHWLSEVARLLPEIYTYYPHLPPPRPLDTPEAKHLFFEGLRQFILSWVRQQDTSSASMLCIDDVHWADASSLDFLAYFIRRLHEDSTPPLCVVCTWRRSSIPKAQSLYHLFLELAHKQRATILSLARLDLTAVQQLLQQTTTLQYIKGDVLAQRLYEETEGLPFFLMAYVQALHTGILKPDDKTWLLPNGIRDLLFSQLITTNDNSRYVLSVAATIGRSFDFDILFQVAKLSEETTITALEDLLARGMLSTLSTPQAASDHTKTYAPLYDFSHEKLRSLVYRETNQARRKLLHRRIADALLQQAQTNQGLYAGQIAHHLHMSGNEQLAAMYYLEAGNYHRTIYAYTEAIANFSVILTFQHPVPSIDILALCHESLGDLYTFQGEYNAAIQHYHQALDLSSSEVHAYLTHKLAQVHERKGEWEHAEHYFATALQLLAATSATDKKARVYADWSLAAHHQGHTQLAQTRAQQALDLAQQSDDPYALAQAHNMLGILATKQQAFPLASYHLEKSLFFAQSLEDTSRQIAALNNLALVSQINDNTSKALELFQSALALCVTQGDRHREAALHSNLADLYHRRGETEYAMFHLKRTVSIYTEIGVDAGTVQPEIWKLTEW